MALTLALAVLPVSHTLAQSPTPQETALARQLFNEGLELADEGDWKGAADRFERAYSLRASPVIAFNLANAWAAAGRLVEASEQLRAVIRDEEADEDLRAAAQEKLDALVPRLAQLTVRLSGHTQGVTVKVDDRPLPDVAIGVAAPADPGTHRVVAYRDDAEIAQREVTLEEGATAEVELIAPAPAPSPEEVAKQAPPPPAPEPTESAERPLAKQWWLWTAVGVVVAGGAVAGVLLATDDGTPDDRVDGNTNPPRLTFSLGGP